MPTMVTRACLACELVFEAVRYADGDEIPADNPDGDLSTDCPRCCGTVFERRFGVPLPTDLNGGRYPYFDRGLGRQIESKEHRRQVCAELGVVPAEGRIATQSGRDAAFEASADAGAEYLRQVNTDHPDYRFIRENRAKKYQLDDGRYVPWYHRLAVAERNKRGQA